MTGKSILIIGCFDTKGEDFGFLYECLKSYGENLLTINCGVMDTKVSFPVDFPSAFVALEGGESIDELRHKRDRGHAVKIMGAGAAKIAAKLNAENKIGGAIGMGGGGGTFISLTAMQEIPLGIPKLCLSTLAGKDVSKRVAGKDITLMPSVVDIAGLNSISMLLIKQAAAAIAGMAAITPPHHRQVAGRIAISMFGNTNVCVTLCSDLLKAAGYEVFAFHANGVGGRTMESLIREGCFDAVLDITTTELADELCGGVCSAGSDRLSAAAERNIPQVVVPGCLDMVNFAQLETVPEEYKRRDLYSWSPDVTLMRTNQEENIILGEILAKKLSASPAPVTVILPTRGISQVDKEGDVFYRPEVDRVLFDTIKKNLSRHQKVVEADAHINDESFANLLVQELFQMMRKKR